MRAKTEVAIREEYGDLFDEEAGPGRSRLIRSLDAGYRAAPLPAAVATFRPLSHAPVVPARRTWRTRRAFVGSVAAVAIVVMVVVGSLAAGKPPKILNLGKPTNDVSPTGFLSLDDFHRIKTNLRVGTKPEVLLVDWLGNTYGDAERWPLVKALEQFGSLSHVSALPGGSGERIAGHNVFSGATFNLSHAHYRSKYLSFSDREVAILGLTSSAAEPYFPYQKISGKALALYKRYAKPHTTTAYVNGGPLIHVAKIPMVVVGNYLANEPGFVGQFDLYSIATTTPACGGCFGRPIVLSFDTIHDALLHDKSPAGRPTLVSDMNAEANVLTALICHADGKRPANVCGRPVIKRLLKLAK